MGPKRKRLNSARTSTRKRSATTTKSTARKATKQGPRKTKGSQEVQYHVGEEVEYDPVHTGSSRRAQGKVTKVLTGAKKSDPSTKEVRYAIENDNTGKATIYGQHSVKKKAKK